MCDLLSIIASPITRFLKDKRVQAAAGHFIELLKKILPQLDFFKSAQNTREFVTFKSVISFLFQIEECRDLELNISTIITKICELESRKQEKKELTNSELEIRGKRQALHILSRIKGKIQGFDSKESKLDVASQVDSIIKQATDPKRLCMMYEGWMSWI